MKTKIFALIISILCLSMIFVACAQECTEHVDDDNDGVCDNCEATVEIETGEETETIAPCEIHKDADADKTCDACGRAVITIVEYVTEEQETRQEMVVNPIPETPATNYIDSTFKGNEYLNLNSSVKIKGSVQYDNYNNDTYLHTIEYDSISGNTMHQVIDISKFDAETGYFKVLWSGTSNNSMGVTYYINMGQYYFTVKKTTVDGFGTTLESQAHAYTYTGESFGKTWVYSEQDTYYQAPEHDYYLNSYDAPEAYYNYYGTTYVFEKATAKLIYSEDARTIKARPVMDTIMGDYGYHCNTNGDLYIYDLTKWREVTYIYKAESKYTTPRYFVLETGKVLMTAFVALPNESVSFDCVVSGVKYDMEYIMIDVATQTGTPVEVGYYIDSWTPAGEGYTDAAAGLYVVTVYPVFEGYINVNEPMTLLVDGDLKVVCQIADLGRLVADGLYIRNQKFFNEKDIYELVDATGKHVDYLNSGDLNGHIIADNKCYTYTGELLVDLDGYYNVDKSYYDYHGYNYYILTKEVRALNGETIYEKYLYVFGKTPIRLPQNDDEYNKDNWNIFYAEDYYMVSYSTSTEGYVASFYSLNGTCFFTLSGEEFYSMNNYGGVRVVATSSSSYYVLK